MTKLPHITATIVQYSSDNNLPTSAQLTAIIDTGSTISVINKSQITKFKLKTQKNSKIRISNAVNSLDITSDEIVKCNLKIGQMELIAKSIYIVEGLQIDLLLGMDCLRNLTLQLSDVPQIRLEDKSKINMYWEPSTQNSLNHVLVHNYDEFQEIKIQEENQKDEIEKIVTWEEKILNPHSFQYIKVRSKQGQSKPKIIRKITYVQMKNKLNEEGLLITPYIGNNGSQIYALNASDKIIYLPKNTEIGTERDKFPGEELYDYRPIAEICEKEILQKQINNLISKKESEKQEINVLTKISSFSKQDQQIHEKELLQWEKYRADLCKNICIQSAIAQKVKETEPKYQDDLGKTLNVYNKIFARTDTDNGFSVKYGIRLIPNDPHNANPRYSPPYKIDNDLALKLNEQIDKSIEAGIMETCASPFNSPILAVRKQNTERLRIVQNYSTKDGVNSKLLISKTPVITTRLLLAKIGFAIKNMERKFPNEEILFSTVDVKNAYYSLSIAESDRNITSFIISNRQIRYVKMVQGLSLSPSCWNQFMTKEFTDGPQDDNSWELCTYMDDILCIAPESKMPIAIKKTLEKIEKANLVLSIEKCKFYQKQVVYLGYVIDSKKVTISEDRTKTLLDTPFPTNHKSSMQFCGIFNYFIRQCPRIQNCLGPLQKQIGAGKRNFKMNEAITEGLKKLKEYIKSGVGQYHIDYNLTGSKIIYI